jgi:hypothetical protein
MRTFTLPNDTCIGTVKEATPQLIDERSMEIVGLDLLNDINNDRQMYAYDYEHSSSSSWSCDEDEDSIVLTRRRVDNADCGEEDCATLAPSPVNDLSAATRSLSFNNERDNGSLQTSGRCEMKQLVVPKSLHDTSLTSNIGRAATISLAEIPALHSRRFHYQLSPPRPR